MSHDKGGPRTYLFGLAWSSHREPETELFAFDIPLGGTVPVTHGSANWINVDRAYYVNRFGPLVTFHALKKGKFACTSQTKHYAEYLVDLLFTIMYTFSGRVLPEDEVSFKGYVRVFKSALDIEYIKEQIDWLNYQVNLRREEGEITTQLANDLNGFIPEFPSTEN